MPKRLYYPEQVAADEVINLLGHTSTTEYVDFSGGKLSLVVFKIDASSPLVNKTLLEITDDRESQPYRTVAISRDGETIIPRGSDQFKVGDNIYVIANQHAVKDVMVFSGKANIDIKNMMILGGSRIGARVAAELQDEVNIKLVDYTPEKAYKLAEQLEKTLIINEDGRNTEAMIEEVLVHKIPGDQGGAVPAQKADVVAIGDEADILTVGLVRHGQPRLPCLLPDGILVELPHRQQQVGQLELSELIEHIALILLSVAAPQQTPAARLLVV